MVDLSVARQECIMLEFNNIKKANSTLSVNYLKIPTTYAETVEDWNNIYKTVLRLEEKGYIKEGLINTKSSGISLRSFVPMVYKVVANQLGAELIFCHGELGYFRLLYRTGRTKDKKGKTITGRKAFLAFKKALMKDGVDITEDYITDGREIKKQIEPPLIKLELDSYKNITFTNVHHIDIRSSYPSGMAEYKPAWRRTIEYIYQHRKERPENKAILNLSCGFFQSKYFGYKLADVSRYAIARNNQKIRDMAKWLTETGRTVLCYNTDGIWFTGESTGFNSTKLGEFNEDHTNCTWKAKSAGAYQFIENGEYTVVQRGYTKLDKVKARSTWEWDDIYLDTAETCVFKFVKGEGIKTL